MGRNAGRAARRPDRPELGPSASIRLSDALGETRPRLQNVASAQDDGRVHPAVTTHEAPASDAMSTTEASSQVSGAPNVVLITGASSGIGAALALELARRGASLVLVARSEDKLRAVAAACGRDAVAVVADVTNRPDVRRAIDTALGRFGRIDVLVNNAGQGISRLPSQLTDEDVDFMIESNVKSALYGMQEILPHFEAQGRGHVINVSSMLGRMPFAVIRSAYCGAKHFLNALTAMFRVEVQQTHPDIQFSLVSPGVVRTEFGLNAVHGGPDSRALPDSQSAEEVAAVIADVIETRRPDVYTRQGSRERVASYYATVGEDA
jgi:NADP-dependent 3-hydroxy acid dehydrogenase YdfG